MKCLESLIDDNPYDLGILFFQRRAKYLCSDPCSTIPFPWPTALFHLSCCSLVGVMGKGEYFKMVLLIWEYIKLKMVTVPCLLSLSSLHLECKQNMHILWKHSSLELAFLLELLFSVTMWFFCGRGWSVAWWKPLMYTGEMLIAS